MMICRGKQEHGSKAERQGEFQTTSTTYEHGLRHGGAGRRKSSSNSMLLFLLLVFIAIESSRAAFQTLHTGASCPSKSSIMSKKFAPSAFDHLIWKNSNRPSVLQYDHSKYSVRQTGLLLSGIKQGGKYDEESSAPKIVAAKDADGDWDEFDGNDIGNQILSLAIPALAGLAIDPLMTLADTAFVGRFSTDSSALAGMGSAAALLTFSFYIFNFLCTATTPLVSRRRATKDEAGAVSVGGQALSLALILGASLCAMLQFFHQPLLNVMGTGFTGQEANEYANSFLLARSFAAPAVFFISAATGVLRGYLDTKTAIYVLAFANVINFSLDAILIAGLGMGPTGAAIATTTAEWIAAILFSLVLAGKIPSADGDLGSNQKQTSISGYFGSELEQDSLRNEEFITIVPAVTVPAWKDVKPLIVASSSVFLRSVILQIALSGAASMAARGYDGAASVAAHQIAIQLWLLCSFVCDALAAASQTLIADAIGRKDPVSVQKISEIVFSYSLALGLILSVFLGLGTASGALLDFFTTDKSIQSELNPILFLIIIAQPLNSLVFAADGVLQGASEFTYQAKTMWLSVASATFCFFSLQNGFGGTIQGGDTLIHVWDSLLVLQFVRGLTSYVKLVDEAGPIRLLSKA
mmetsp:Transcript_12734/g.19209  ORF Transcript_12734/g.19209 Transcript_12734/m.19209 type:complete len:638 (-) Transcript_12734:395-2308(-)|eukprot:CAMPEP_0196802848 /NCGR_PEP_ID=MMETSP1362-20130617/2386_1 /TAXON_ID=163516 /ORGANISM="Leptocylindrus danicus, Strain CCMP1856" /LENGTH=637 /DNA_ID=CAMNT_0042174251 /DNA_START=206 /DNA_END=2119 /DNA_ORIENTATION=+